MPDVVPVEIFAALSDESRWEILTKLGSEPASASGLAAELPISRQAIAKHLAVLTAAGLVTSSRAGREIRYEAVGAELSRIARQLETIARGWDRRLAAIKSRAEEV